MDPNDAASQAAPPVQEMARKNRWLELLREKDSQLKAMVEAFDGLIYVCSQDYRVEYINERYIKRLGYDATGQICYKALHHRDDVCPWCLNNRIFKGETVRCEVLSHRNNWYHVVSTPIFHPDGSVSKHAMIIDISDRKKAELSLKKKVEEQELLLDNIQTQVWYLTDAGTYGAVNQAHARFLGREKADIQGRAIDAVWPPSTARAMTVHNEEVFAGKARRIVEQWVENSQGQKRLLSISQTPKLDGDGNVEYVVCSARDITDYRTWEEKLRDENLRLKTSLKGSSQFGDIIGHSPAMREVYEIILKAAQSNANVIIYGESGTGKELVAQTIHNLSSRNSNKFVTVNCGAIPATLVESEFFGYAKGAFTGAERDKPGLLDAADGGTLFLDEVGELDLNMQVKLLRAVEGGGYTPIGRRRVIRPDVRIIAATNKDLKDRVEKGLVREDFYYRIHIIPIHLPPLRDRREDIPLLIHHFLQKYSQGMEIPPIAEKVMQSMKAYDWPGNVRELQNTIHRYVTLRVIDFSGGAPARGTDPAGLPADLEQPRDLELRSALARFEKQYIQQALQAHKWRRSKAASLLGIDRRTLFRKIKDFGIK